MKRLSIPLLVLACFALLLLGCSDTPEPVSPQTSAAGGPTSLMKPTESGAMVLKYEDVAAFAFYDAEEGLILTLGLNDFAGFCAGGVPFDLFDIKDLYLPGTDPSLRRVIRQMKGEDIVAILFATDTWPVALCSLDPIAVGTADVIRTDNDLLAGTQDNPNANSFGQKAHGSLVGTDGQLYRLNLVYHAVWDGVDLSSFRQIVKIQLAAPGPH